MEQQLLRTESMWCLSRPWDLRDFIRWRSVLAFLFTVSEIFLGSLDRKVLQLAQQPSQKLSVANVGEFLDQEASRIARERSLEEAVMFLAQGWRRSEEGGVVPSTWDGIGALQEAVLTSSLALLLSASSDQKVWLGFEGEIRARWPLYWASWTIVCPLGLSFHGFRFTLEGSWTSY